MAVFTRPSDASKARKACVEMKRVLTFVTFAAITAIAVPALAADCLTEAQPRIEAALSKTPLEAGITDGVKSLLAQPRYFEDPKQGAVCSRPKLDNPLYPGIPVKECAYQHLGLTGWVMVANPGAEVVAKWISNACAETADAKTCAVRLTAQTWCASQFSFPVVGNLIEPVTSDGKSVGVNTAYLHGVAIARPQWLPEKASVGADIQKQRLSSLVASDKAYTGLTAPASWPSGLTPAVYTKYAAAPANLAKEPSVGAACPIMARRAEWLNASRVNYNQAWRNGRNRMFDAAAKALMAGEAIAGTGCSS